MYDKLLANTHNCKNQQSPFSTNPRMWIYITFKDGGYKNECVVQISFNPLNHLWPIF